MLKCELEKCTTINLPNICMFALTLALSRYHNTCPKYLDMIPKQYHNLKNNEITCKMTEIRGFKRHKDIFLQCIFSLLYQFINNIVETNLINNRESFYVLCY